MHEERSVAVVPLEGFLHGRKSTLAWFAAISLWLWWRAWPGLFVYFEADDMTNLYKAWEFHPSWLALSNLTPFTPVYRPAGAAVYRVLFGIFGLDPFPFRICAYVLMTVNVALAMALARRLTGSREIAVITAMLGAFHYRAFDLYFNNGTVYDILCYTFSIAFLLVYTRVRPRWTWGSSAALYSLLTLALNSKEMALMLPALLWAYELIYHRSYHLFTREKLWCWIATALAGGAAVAKVVHSQSPLAAHPYYTPQLSLSRYLESTHSFLVDLFYRSPATLPVYGAILLLLIMVLVAILWKRADFRFGVVFLLVTPLPVNFIAPRGFFVMYLPLFGWALCIAVLLGVLVCRLRASARVLAILMIAAFMALVQSRDRPTRFEEGPLAKSIRKLHGDVLRAHPSMPRGSKLLFLDDEFTNDNWTPVFVLRLAYRDPGLQVDRVKMTGRPRNAASYRHVFSYSGGRLQSQ